MRNIAGLKPTNKVFGYILGALFVIAAAAALLGGCGTDEITGTGGNPPAGTGDSLIFSVDILSIYGTGIQDKDTTIPINTMHDSIKLTFTLESNCDTLAFASGEVGNIAFTISNGFNNSFSYSGRINSAFNGFRVYFNSTLPKYLRMKNIKLYKINPV